MGKSYFNVSDATTVFEGDAATFWITRTGDTSRTEQIKYWVNGIGESATGGYYNDTGLVDFQQNYSTFVEFKPGETAKQFTVQTYDDTNINIIEGAEQYKINILMPQYGVTNPYNGRTGFYSNLIVTDVGDAIGYGMILDNDGPTAATVVNTPPIVDMPTIANTNNVTNNVDNSINNTITQNFNITINGDNNSLGDFGNTQFQQTGTQGADIITGNSAVAETDILRGMEGDDNLVGYRGADVLVGDAGNDIVRGGNGRDVLTGGVGGDTIYGGFGQNTFTGELDGAVDRIYFKSDHLASNWLYGKAGNQNGNKVDVIGSLDDFDLIFVEGALDSQLSYGATTAGIQGQNVSGIGIYAGNVLEAIYTGNNLTTNQLDAMTTGVPV